MRNMYLEVYHVWLGSVALTYILIDLQRKHSPNVASKKERIIWLVSQDLGVVLVTPSNQACGSVCLAAALSGGSYCSNNSSRVLHQQRKPWHWAVLGGAVTALRKHLNKWFFSYAGVKSSASSECKFSIYQTVVPCNPLGSQRLLFSPLIFPPH